MCITFSSVTYAITRTNAHILNGHLHPVHHDRNTFQPPAENGSPDYAPWFVHPLEGSDNISVFHDDLWRPDRVSLLPRSVRRRPFPGFLYLSDFYRRHELQTRIGLTYGVASLSGAFLGLLAAAIEKMSGIGGLKGHKMDLSARRRLHCPLWRLRTMHSA